MTRHVIYGIHVMIDGPVYPDRVDGQGRRAGAAIRGVIYDGKRHLWKNVIYADPTHSCGPRA
jgi:hypothetical protein